MKIFLHLKHFSTGSRVKLACVNWYGAHMEGHVVNGLDKRSIEGIATTIASLGFNCVRQTNPLEVRAVSLWHKSRSSSGPV